MCRESRVQFKGAIALFKFNEICMREKNRVLLVIDLVARGTHMLFAPQTRFTINGGGGGASNDRIQHREWVSKWVRELNEKQFPYFKITDLLFSLSSQFSFTWFSIFTHAYDARSTYIFLHLPRCFRSLSNVFHFDRITIRSHCACLHVCLHILLRCTRLQPPARPADRPSDRRKKTNPTHSHTIDS